MTDPESFPKLVQPEGAEAGEGASSTRSAPADTMNATHADATRRLLPGGLAFLLFLAILGLISQARSLSTLRGEVNVLGEELAHARTDLAAYREQMTRVRVEVTEVFGRIEALRELVSEDPTAAAPAAPSAPVEAGFGESEPVVGTSHTASEKPAF